MAEEQKSNEQPKAAQDEKGAVQPNAPQQAAVAAKPQEEKAARPAKIKVTNCAHCNKALLKRLWYYRNNKYYCSKGCWKGAVDKEKKEKEAAQKEAAEKLAAQKAAGDAQAPSA